MPMRVTTNGVFYGYRKDLGKSYYRFSKSMTRVTTQRNFSAYSEDVSAASRAFQVRRSHWRASNQITNSNYVISKFQTGWSALDYIVDGEGMEDNLNSIVESLRGLNDASGSARNALGESVVNKAGSIVRLLNTQYGDQFIFAGADGRNVPLTWETDETTGETYLAYRGIDVNTPEMLTREEFEKLFTIKHVVEYTDPVFPGTDDNPTDHAPDPDVTNPAEPGERIECWEISVPAALKDFTFSGIPKEGDDHLSGDNYEPNHYADADAAYEALKAFDFDTAYEDYKNQFDTVYAKYTHGKEGATVSGNYEKLLAMSQEATYVDVGIGVRWDSLDPTDPNYDPDKLPDLIPSSAYNSALNALSFLGFGSRVAENGELLSNNLVELMMDMGNMLKSCDSMSGTYPEGWDSERTSVLTRKIEISVGSATAQHVKLSNEVGYLETNLAQLTAQRDNLNEQILAIEQIDPADAITEFLYARYAYNAALSVGNTVLTNTLLDYLR